MGISSWGPCQYNCADSRTKWLLGALRAYQSPQMAFPCMHIINSPTCSRCLCLLRNLQHSARTEPHQGMTWGHISCTSTQVLTFRFQKYVQHKGMNYMLANLQMNTKKMKVTNPEKLQVKMSKLWLAGTKKEMKLFCASCPWSGLGQEKTNLYRSGNGIY